MNKPKSLNKDAYELANDLFQSGDYAAAFEKYDALTKVGSVESFLQIGWMFEKGLGIKKDDRRALGNYNLAAHLGSVQGKHYAARIYLEHREYQSAMRLLREAASNGYGPSSYRLGRIFEKGMGVSPDLAQATTWYDKSSRQQHLLASLALSRIRMRDGTFQGRIVGFAFVVFGFLRIAAEGFRDPDSDRLRE